jgi:hypothetical protein
MFEAHDELVPDPDEWEPIPASELASVGGWEFSEVTGDEPGRFDRWVSQVVAESVSSHTLAVLADVPPGSLSAESRSQALRQLEKLSRHIDALKAEVTAVIAGPKPVINAQGRIDDFAANEVAVATWTSVYAADHRVWASRDLAGRLAATHEALRCGEASWPQAVALSEATSRLDTDLARQVEAKMLKYSHRQDIGKFKAALRRWVAKLDPDFTAKAKEARKAAEVSHTPHEDGTGSLYIRGPLELTTAVAAALTAYAAQTKAMLGGTADQRKLAGLRDWAEAYLASPGCPTQHGRPPMVNITIDLATLLGMRDRPAYIPGVGPVPADAARWAIADGAPIRRLVTDPLTGHLLDHGAETYTASAGLADYLIARNVTSASPHSSVDARGCDIEHNTPHGQHGRTSQANCTPVDRRWHRAKTHGNWTYTKDDDGVVIWRSPAGMTCAIDPYDYSA